MCIMCYNKNVLHESNILEKTIAELTEENVLTNYLNKFKKREDTLISSIR